MKYFGDQWLAFDDIYDSMSDYERYGFIMSGGLGYSNGKYLAHVTGQKEDLMRHLAWTIGVNKVFRSNPEKYKKIWARPNRRGVKIEIHNLNKPIEEKTTHNYIG